MMNMENFYNSLTVLYYGMAGIFVVIMVMYITIKLLLKTFPPK